MASFSGESQACPIVWKGSLANLPPCVSCACCYGLDTGSYAVTKRYLGQDVTLSSLTHTYAEDTNVCPTGMPVNVISPKS